MILINDGRAGDYEDNCLSTVHGKIKCVFPLFLATERPGQNVCKAAL